MFILLLLLQITVKIPSRTLLVGLLIVADDGVVVVVGRGRVISRKFTAVKNLLVVVVVVVLVVELVVSLS